MKQRSAKCGIMALAMNTRFSHLMGTPEAGVRKAPAVTS